MSPQQLMSVCEAAMQCDVVSVRVNALAILGITGSTLAKGKGSAETLQVNISAYDFNLQSVINLCDEFSGYLASFP